MRKIPTLAALAISALAISPLSAAVVDADAFAAGTDISNAFAGVTLQTVFTGANVEDITGTGSVFSVDSGVASTGARAFGSRVNDDLWGNGQFEYLLVTFDTVTTSVSLDFAANDTDDTNPQLLAFDAMGAQIDIDSAPFVTLGTPITLTVTGTGIKSIRAYWDEINRANNGGLDNLVFDGAVPEPATWAMMIAGFGLVGSAMRRTRSRYAIA